MSDAELTALAVLVASENITMAGDNQQREHQGQAAAWTSDCPDSDAHEALRSELARRSLLPAEAE